MKSHSYPTLSEMSRVLPWNWEPRAYPLSARMNPDIGYELFMDVGDEMETGSQYFQMISQAAWSIFGREHTLFAFAYAVSEIVRRLG